MMIDQMKFQSLQDAIRSWMTRACLAIPRDFNLYKMQLEASYVRQRPCKKVFQSLQDAIRSIWQLKVATEDTHFNLYKMQLEANKYAYRALAERISISTRCN